MQDTDPPQPSHTTQFLRLLDLGLSSCFSLTVLQEKEMAPFLFDDLIPRLLKGGYVPVYANLLNAPGKPHISVLNALENTLAALEESQGVSNLLAGEAHGIEDEMSTHYSHTAPTSLETAKNQDLWRLNALMSLLEEKAGKGRLLIILDHFDYLTTSHQFDNITYSLRTQLDTRQEGIKSLFIGYSLTDMKTLLCNSRSAFYKFATALPFFI